MTVSTKAKKCNRKLHLERYPDFLLGGGSDINEIISHEDMVHDNPYSESDGSNIFGLNDRSNPVYKAAKLLASIGYELDLMGDFKTADKTDSLLKLVAQGQAHATPGNAKNIATTLQGIIYQLLNRVQPDKRAAYLYKIRAHLQELNPSEIAIKRNNASAAIGSALNVVKNVLIGQPPDVISATINELVRLV